MDRYLAGMKRGLTTAIVAAFVLCNVPARAQDQDASTKIDELRKEISFLSSRVCPAGVAKDSAFDARMKTLTADRDELKALLDQKKARLTGSDLDTTVAKQHIDDEEKALAADCPALPPELDKLVRAAAGMPAATPTPTPQVTVSPAGALDFDPQTIGNRSDPKSLTITNGSAAALDLWVWYGTHLNNFRITDNTCDTWVAPQGSCSVKVTFAPLMRTWPEERLRVVRRSDWAAFEKVRQAQIEVDAAAGHVNELREAAGAETKEAIGFCGTKPTKPAQLVQACTDLSGAEAKLDAAVAAFNAYFRLNKQVANVTEAADYLKDQAFAVIPLSGSAIHWKYPLTRGVVGVDISAVSSQTVKQAYFVEFNLLAPFRLGHYNDDPLEDRWWFWLNPRITSLPKAADFSSLSTISESGSFFSNFSNQGTVADIAHGFDVNGGLEWAALKPRDGIPWWGEYQNTQARLGISLIAGAGTSTPFSVDKTNVPSQVNQGICDAFKAPTGTPVSGPGGLVCTFPTDASGNVTSNNPVILAPNPIDPTKPAVQDQFVNFVTPDRTRFFRRYYGGFRLKTYFFSPDVKGECSPKRSRCDAPYDIFPGIIDVTVGQDEAVTAGKLKNVLLRVEGVYPLPFYPGLHVFGSIYTAFKGNHADFPLNSFDLNNPTAGTSNDFNTFRFAPPPLNRDYFRVGIGVDLIQVFKRGKGGQPTTTTAKPDQSQTDSAAKPAGK